MPNFKWSFAWAVIFHIFLILPWAIFPEKKTSLIVSEPAPKRFIDFKLGKNSIRHGSSTDNTSLQKHSASSAHIRNDSSKIANENGDAESTQSSGSASNDESGNTSFEAASVYYQAPIYPKVARMRGLEGDTRLKILVSAQGELVSSSIVKSSGHEVLDQSALDAAKNWKFQKSSAQYYVEKEIVFKLTNPQ